MRKIWASTQVEERALASLLLDSENANHFCMQINPEETWPNLDLFVPHSRLNAKGSQKSVNKQSDSVGVRFYRSLDVRKQPRGQAILSPTDRTRSTKQSGSKIRLRNLSMDSNSVGCETYRVRRAQVCPKQISKRFEILQQKIHRIGMKAEGKGAAERKQVEKDLSSKHPISYSRYVKERKQQTRLSQRMSCFNSMF